MATGILRRHDPNVPDLRTEIERIFEDFMSPRSVFGGAVAEFSPRVEIVERDGEYLLRAELPGVNASEVSVDLNDDVLTIRGERRQEVARKTKGYEYSEFGYGSFSRSIQLPPSVDASKIEADFDNGVLQVKIPKSDTAKPRQIPIGAQEKGHAEAVAEAPTMAAEASDVEQKEKQGELHGG